MSQVFQPAGNYYDKYRTANPIARYLMRGFLDSFDALSGRISVPRALEVGCGEGELSIRLACRGLEVRGCDISPEIVTEARERAAQARVHVDFGVASLEAMKADDPAPLVVCCEVLEHLDDPVAGLDVLAGLARPYLLASVPREPLWRVLNMARGRYWGRLGNTPGHVNHWNRRQFIAFVERRFRVLEVRAPLPWTMLLCEAR
jgi:2-polyprenyl-3-methyl-5-hydroxy-6-metoxy-1,4-benzoquinol methylase